MIAALPQQQLQQQNNYYAMPESIKTPPQSENGDHSDHLNAVPDQTLQGTIDTEMELNADSTPKTQLGQLQTSLETSTAQSPPTPPLSSRAIPAQENEASPLKPQPAPITEHITKALDAASSPRHSITSSSSMKPLSIISANEIAPLPANPATSFTQNIKNSFGWLSRASNSDKKALPSPPNGRVNGILSTRESPSNAASLASLKDQFRLLRQQQEQQESASVVSPTNAPISLLEKSDSIHLSRSRSSSVINFSLPPGTAAGVAEGPRDNANHPVNWDMWQGLVTDGPAALVNKSDEELNQAIAAGIPLLIRNVIWQVLAGSKNEYLESCYHNLVAKGTHKETQLPASSTPLAESQDETITSSASSVHSDMSSSRTRSPSVGPTSPSSSTDASASPSLTLRKSGDGKQTAVDAQKLQRLEKMIKRDMPRTSYSKYAMSKELQSGLFDVCKAYALLDDEVGYAQNMTYIVQPMLFIMSPEEAFCLFHQMMFKYGLRDMFAPDIPGLHLHLYQFERLLEDREPALHCHLKRHNVPPILYATQWFLTLFAYCFPLQLVHRIYDLILSSSLPISILKFAIILMQKNRDTLLSMTDMTRLKTFLNSSLFDVYIDKAPSASSILESEFFGFASGDTDKIYRADDLVKDACAVEISEKTLAKYNAEWVELTRIKKEQEANKLRQEKVREAERQSLKSENQSFARKIRDLENRVEKNDTEQVVLASNLVRLRIENENLQAEKDKFQGENEGLKIQVDELKRIVDSQPVEIENRMKAEIDAVMKRNTEVHNSNELLSKENEDLEQMLIKTKVEHAKLHSDHETLKLKLRDVAQLINK